MSTEGLIDRFARTFGAPPTHLSRAPGRVNLIGEHTDYNDLPVLPAALQREVRIVLRPRSDGLVRLANVRAEFPSVEYEIGVALERGPEGAWENYLKAPAWELARRHAIARGFDGLVSSDVPVASGLSSSSALVVAVGLALSRINEVGLEALELARLMADAERFTGTRGGGMDQAISAGARAGHAARIDFSPLRMHHVPVPVDWRFVVADTGVRAEKSGPAQAAYNRRRSECEEALALVEGALTSRGAPLPRRAGRGYGAVMAAHGTRAALDLGEEVLSGNLLKRYRHVVSEAQRVADAQDALLQADHMAFGMLMDASHGSLRTDYNVSSAELDELVALAKEGGAAGARLTGAGFGGCIVALTAPSTLDGVLEALVSGYYEARGLTEDLDDRLFVAVPSAGASFEELA
ncbi:MAG: galactokinase [Gemmatimonadota bacterium]